MAQSVKLSEEILASVRSEAALRSRSVTDQISRWLKLGHAIERSGSYDHARVTAALEGKLDPTKLEAGEEAAWLDAFTDKMEQPSEADEAFFTQRQSLGLGVGLDADGILFYAKKGGSG